MYFLRVDQDKIIRILFKDTPEEIGGFYTDTLATCTMVVLIGVYGMTAVHDSGRLDISYLNQEMNIIGDIQKVLFIKGAFNIFSSFESVCQKTCLALKSLLETTLFDEFSSVEIFSANTGFFLLERNVKLGDLGGLENKLVLSKEEALELNLELEPMNALLSFGLAKMTIFSCLCNFEDTPLSPYIQYDGQNKSSLLDERLFLSKKAFQEDYLGKMGNSLFLCIVEYFNDLEKCGNKVINEGLNKVLPQEKNWDYNFETKEARTKCAFLAGAEKIQNCLQENLQCFVDIEESLENNSFVVVIREFEVKSLENIILEKNTEQYISSTYN